MTRILRIDFNYLILKCITIFYLFAAIATSPSCAIKKKIEYLQDSTDLKAFSETELPEYRLKPNDEVYIQINSLDVGFANVFSSIGNQQLSNIGTITPYGASLLSYSVDKNGFLMLPVIGNINVKDKTLIEVSNLLRDSLMNVLNQPIITVKLVNRYITVLGDVRNPGHFPYSQEKLSVFDALGMAGDITDFGNRKEVILVRNENNQNIRSKIDLTTSNILNSDLYYLRPNDLIYVKPLHTKYWNIKQVPVSLVLSAITTGLLIYSILR